ncbi:hypothetical protein RA27_00795 [Ruegeria sp. ANG-R]|nr:hypothetical protein RA27_00795 [Ruegeria sp. ANG-R]
MKSILSTMLATDDVASQFGCKLKPQLRAAIQADLRFPVHAASPLPQPGQIQNDLPANVMRLSVQTPPKQRSSA